MMELDKDFMLKQIDDYFNNTTKKQFEKDLEETGSAHMVEDIDEEFIKGFISSCEREYGMSTEEFHKWYKERDYEGNSDHQIWYTFTIR